MKRVVPLVLLLACGSVAEDPTSQDGGNDSSSTNDTGTDGGVVVDGGAIDALPDAPPPPPYIPWSRSYGTSSQQIRVGPGPSGGVLLAGHAGANAVTFGGNAGGPAFIVSLDRDANHLYSTLFNGYDAAGGGADAAGNLYFAGTTTSTIDLGGGAITPSPQAGYLIKLDPKGKVLWQKQFAKAVEARGLLVDAAGNVTLAIKAGGTFDLGGGSKSYPGDWIIVRYDAAGAWKWETSIGTCATNQCSLNGFARDSQGAIVLAGSMKQGDQITFGGSTTMTSTNGGGSDAIVGKLDAAGKYVFGTKFTSTNVTFAGVGVDGAGNLYVDGTFTGTLNFGSGPLTAQNYDLCVAKLGPTGTVIWGKKFGGGGNESATQLVVDAAGNLDVIGNYDAAFNFGLGNLTFVGPTDLFRARFDSNGVVQSSKGWGTGSPIYAQSAVHDSEGHLVIAGSFGGSVDFGNGTITANQTSIFVTTFP